MPNTYLINGEEFKQGENVFVTEFVLIDDKSNDKLKFEFNVLEGVLVGQRDPDNRHYSIDTHKYQSSKLEDFPEYWDETIAKDKFTSKARTMAVIHKMINREVRQLLEEQERINNILINSFQDLI